MISTTVTRRGKQVPRAHYFLTSLRTKSEALLRLIRQRWSIENEWHWPRDTQLHEDAHRYANRNGTPLFAFLPTVVMNLLRNGGYRSVHAGQQELSHNIQGECSHWEAWQRARVENTFRRPWWSGPIGRPEISIIVGLENILIEYERIGVAKNCS